MVPVEQDKEDTITSRNETIKCTKCGGEMSAGFMLSVGFRGAAGAVSWQGGEPEPSFWTGIKQSGKECHSIDV